MKSKKLKLDQLQIKSFFTTLNEDENQTVNGGGLDQAGRFLSKRLCTPFAIPIVLAEQSVDWCYDAGHEIGNFISYLWPDEMGPVQSEENPHVHAKNLRALEEARRQGFRPDNMEPRW